MGIVNDRSYIVKDSFDNYYRRNRRFIARTNNVNFNASDLMYEENIKNNHNHNNLEKLKEIQIVPSPGGLNDSTNCEANENVLLDMNKTLNESSSDDYETADSSDSEAGVINPELNNSQNTVEPELLTQPNIVKTRSGRTSRPPKRYGWD